MVSFHCLSSLLHLIHFMKKVFEKFKFLWFAVKCQCIRADREYQESLCPWTVIHADYDFSSSGNGVWRGRVVCGLLVRWRSFMKKMTIWKAWTEQSFSRLHRSSSKQLRDRGGRVGSCHHVVVILTRFWVDWTVPTVVSPLTGNEIFILEWLSYALLLFSTSVVLLRLLDPWSISSRTSDLRFFKVVWTPGGIFAIIAEFIESMIWVFRSLFNSSSLRYLHVHYSNSF